MRVLVSGGVFEERSAAAEVLRDEGAAVAEAAGTPEALRLLASALHRNVPFDLVLDLEGSLGRRVAEVFPEHPPRVVRTHGSEEALAAFQACGGCGGQC